jgi:hypothetical protein
MIEDESRVRGEEGEGRRERRESDTCISIQTFKHIFTNY